jgi:hypothetical protein
MRRREIVSLLALVLVGAVLLTRALSGSGEAGAGSTALKIAVLAVIVAAILATRLGPRGR